jgi:hypothetical protein
MRNAVEEIRKLKKGEDLIQATGLARKALGKMKEDQAVAGQ